VEIEYDELVENIINRTQEDGALII